MSGIAQAFINRYKAKKFEHPDWYLWTFYCDSCHGMFVWDVPREKCSKCDPVKESNEQPA